MERTQTIGGVMQSQVQAGYSRPAFHQGQVLAPADLNAVVDYSREKLQGLLRSLVGPGLAEGLAVKPAQPEGTRILVEPGYAVDAAGRDLFLQHPVELDLAVALEAATRVEGPMTYEVRIRAAEGARNRVAVGGPWLPDGSARATVRTTEGVVLEAVPVYAGTTYDAVLQPALQLLKLAYPAQSVVADGTSMLVSAGAKLLVYDTATLTELMQLDQPAPEPATTKVIEVGGITLTLNLETRTLRFQTQDLTSLPPITDAVADPRRNRLFLAFEESNVVGVLDPLTLRLTGVIPAGRGPAQLLLHPAGSHLVVINHGSVDISLIDLGTGHVAGRLSAPEGPGEAAFDDQGRLWVPGTETGTMLVGDPLRPLGLAGPPATSSEYLPLAQIHLAPNQTHIQASQIDHSVRNAYRMTTLAHLSRLAAWDVTRR